MRSEKPSALERLNSGGISLFWPYSLGQVEEKGVFGILISKSRKFTLLRARPNIYAKWFFCLRHFGNIPYKLDVSYLSNALQRGALCLFFSFPLCGTRLLEFSRKIR